MSINYQNNLQSSSRSFNSRKIPELNFSWGLMLENYAKSLTSREIFFHDYDKGYQEKNESPAVYSKKKYNSLTNFNKLEFQNSFRNDISNISFITNNKKEEEKVFSNSNSNFYNRNLKNDLARKENKNKLIFNKNFVNNFIVDEFDKKTSYSNIKWEDNSYRNFDSNNELINILKIDKNMNLNDNQNNKKRKINIKKNNSITNFNYNLDEMKNSGNKNLNLNLINEDKEIYLFNESSNFAPSRNASDLNKILLFWDENNVNNEKFDNSKENINNNNNNTLRNYSFEKMINKKFSSNKSLKDNDYNQYQYSNNNELDNNNNFKRKNSLNRINFKEEMSKKNNENKNYEKIKNYKISEPSENPIDKYFQKRHLREIQKLDSLRQEKINKEISEVKDRPSISDTSKKIFNQKIQENKNFKNVFDRLLAPSQRLEEETYQNISYTPKINQTSKRCKRNLSDLFDWQKKVEEKNEILFELTYGKHKKHLFTTKSAKSIKTITYDKKDDNKKRNLKKVFSCKNLNHKRNKFNSPFDKIGQINNFCIKELNYDKNKTNEETKVINIETLDYVPMSTRITNLNTGNNTKRSEIVFLNKSNQTGNDSKKYHAKNIQKSDSFSNNNISNRRDLSNNITKIEENDMSFNVNKNEINNKEKNSINEENSDNNNNKLNYDSYDKNLIPAYLNFKGDINNIKNNQSNNDSSNNSNNQKNKIEIQVDSNSLKEKKIEEFYAKLKNQPILNNSNYHKIEKNNFIFNNINDKIPNFVSNNENKKLNKNNKENLNARDKKTNLKLNNNETPKIDQNKKDFKMEKKFNSQYSKFNVKTKNNSSSKSNLNLNKKINNSNFDNKNNDLHNNSKMILNINSNKNKKIIERDSSAKKSNEKLSKNNLNDKSNVKNHHVRNNSQIPINKDNLNKFQSTRLRNVSSSSLFANKSQIDYDNHSIINYEKNHNMNEIKRQVNMQNVEELNMIKKEQILESRKFLNEYLSKRNKEIKENCNSSTNNSWRKNIQINMDN